MFRRGHPVQKLRVHGRWNIAHRAYNVVREEAMNVPTRPANDHHKELNSLFYWFRTAELNSRYYSAWQRRLEFWDKLLQVVIALATALSFGILAFSGFWPSPQTGKVIAITAASLSLIAFVASTVVPWVGLGRKIDEARTRNVVWSNASQQFYSAIRFVKQARELDDSNGEIIGCMRCAEDAYERAAATLPAEPENEKLVQKISEEIRRTFPADYVWNAF